jgi:3-isopropylmalate/(R)-2-methylmalate dehydratase small subunit
MTLHDLNGRVAWIFQEDNFDVDQIVGVKNIKLTDIGELAHAAMTSYDPEFAKVVRPGDLIIGGKNFGYGHPHYPPMKVTPFRYSSGNCRILLAGILARGNKHGVSLGGLSGNFKDGRALA